MTDESFNRIEQYLWPKGFRRDVFMIVDGARDRRIFSLLLECHLDYSCLYAGRLPPALEPAAPYLVQLDFEYGDTRRLLKEAWGNAWGICVRCDAGTNVLRRHLRRLLVVLDPASRRMLFRYYDPRVLRVYLPTCTREELQTVFGPVSHFYAEAESPETLLEYGFDQLRMRTRELALDRPVRA